MKALLPIWDQIDCQKAYTRLFISSSQMCAGYKEGGQDTCQVICKFQVHFLYYFNDLFSYRAILVVR